MPNWIGRSLSRVEDDALLRGRGHYVADISRSNELHVIFARSQEAHAFLKRIDCSRARNSPGVITILTADDVPATPMPPFLWDIPPEELVSGLKIQMKHHDQHLLATDRVRYVGEPLAMIVARDRYSAEDALEKLDVEYDSVPAVTRPGSSAALLHDEWGDNVGVRLEVSKGDAAGALASAAHVVHETFEIQRQAGIPLEGRGAIAEFDIASKRLMLWSSTQNVHPLQKAVAGLTGIPVENVRVVAPDVGGGFGTKGILYPEELLLAWTSIQLERPLKWIEDRVEHMQSAIHARDQRHQISLGLDAGGCIVALEDHFDLDAGAFNPLGIVIPYNSIAHLMGPYRVPNFLAEATLYVTNKTPMAPYRGAGRPEAVFATERVVERAAKELGLDPVELRLRNLIRPDEMPYEVGIPYRDAQPIVLDGGDFPASMRDAAELLETRKSSSNASLVEGVGFAAYIEGTAIGPFEGATVRVEAGGRVSVSTGAASQGQGHRTSFAQICAESLGVHPDQVDVWGGDTGSIRYGWGTVASRSAVVAGNAVAAASYKVREKIERVASELLEISIEDVEIDDGAISPKGVPEAGISVAELAAGLEPGNPLFRDLGPGLEATEYYEPPTVTWAHGVHGVRVGVDLDTCEIHILDYVVVHDCGRIINPIIVDGQIHGGIAQGIGGGLLEEIVYNADGQLVTGTFMDYLLPGSMEVPLVRLRHRETPSPRNALGLKGMGEGGAIPPPAALANAVEDALSDRDVVIRRTPITSSYLFDLLNHG